MRELSGVMEMFYIVIVVVATQLYTLVKTHQTVHIKLVDFILYELYSSQQKNKYVLLHQTKIPNGSRTETSIARWQTAWALEPDCGCSNPGSMTCFVALDMLFNLSVS